MFKILLSAAITVKISAFTIPKAEYLICMYEGLTRRQNCILSDQSKPSQDCLQHELSPENKKLSQSSLNESTTSSAMQSDTRWAEILPVPERVMNQTVRAYQPNKEDILLTISSGEYQRILFKGHEFKEKELAHLERFRDYARSENINLPISHSTNDQVLRFLQSNKWDNEKAYADLLWHSQWQSQVNLDINSFIDDLQLGVVYGVSRDKSMRPIIMINGRRLIDQDISIERMIDLSNYLFEYTIEHAMIPGSIESWIIILDLKGVGMTEIPVKKLQPLVETMNKNYRGRLYRFYATNTSFVLRSLWHMVRTFVDEFTKNKLNVYGSNFIRDISDLIDPQNLEQLYSGQMPNIEANFFPPAFNP